MCHPQKRANGAKRKYDVNRDTLANIFFRDYFKTTEELQTNMKMYNYNLKTSFVSPEMPKARANKTSSKIMIIIQFYICRNLDIIRCDA